MVWRKARPIVLAVSITLNVALLATWGAHAIPAHARRDPDEQTRTQPEVWRPLHRELGVTEQQWQKIEPQLLEFHERAREICRELRERRGELLDLLAAPQPDMEAVNSKRAEVLEGHDRMQKLVLGRLLEEKEVLNPEQQAKLFSMIRGRMNCPGPGRMMGLGRRPHGNDREGTPISSEMDGEEPGS